MEKGMLLLVSVIFNATAKPEPSTACLVIGKSPWPYAEEPNNPAPKFAPPPEVDRENTAGCGVVISS